MFNRRAASLIAIGGLLAGSLGAVAAGASPDTKDQTGPVEVSAAVAADVSVLPVRDLNGAAPAASSGKEKHEKPLRVLPNMGNALNQPDGALQSSSGPAVATSTGGLSFAGVGNGDYGFAPNAAPPDTNGAVGATQYVQWVNESFAVFDKTTGGIVPGFPKAGNSIWAGFGGACEANNDGDPIVQYDKAAQRWILTQFSVKTTPYLQCVAVSTSSDATGTYNRYAFSYGATQFNDYPKLGVWPDGYYVSYNIFNGGNTFAGSKVCALDRSAMLAGAPATQQCFQLGTSYGGLLPSDLDGSVPPPVGAPNLFMNFGANSLNLWKFHVDWSTPANSTFTGPTNIAVASFSAACSGGGTCIPQAGTTQKLDSLADRLMYRLAYRKFADGHEALVVNHSVTAGNSVGIRWYEIRDPNGTPTVYQQGTYAPDATYRWMGSIAMDRTGNIALGYSVSSATLSPGIRYSGRVPTDPLGTLQSENSIIPGGGSQILGLSRWGDYSSMTVDPVDDCTFWFTSEYLKTTGSFNWSTRIASFKFPSCTTQTPVLTSITVAPSTASVPTGGTQQFIATGFDQSGKPLSPQPTFTWSVIGGGTIDQSTGVFIAGPTAGTSTVTATSGPISGSATATVTSGQPVLVLTTINVTPSTASVQAGGTQQFTATGFDQTGASIFPQPTFTWSVIGGGTIGTSTGVFTAGSTAGTSTVTATGGTVSGTATVTVSDFTLSVAPTSVTIQRGATATFKVTITRANGFSGPVTFALAGQPVGSTVAFSPNLVDPTKTLVSTLTVATQTTQTRGTSTLTITGSSGPPGQQLSRNTTATLKVTR